MEFPCFWFKSATYIISYPSLTMNKPSVHYLRSCNTLQAGLQELALQRVHGIPDGKSKDAPMPTQLQDSQPVDSLEAESVFSKSTLPWLCLKNMMNQFIGNIVKPGLFFCDGPFLYISTNVKKFLHAAC